MSPFDGLKMKKSEKIKSQMIYDKYNSKANYLAPLTSPKGINQIDLNFHANCNRMFGQYKDPLDNGQKMNTDFNYPKKPKVWSLQRKVSSTNNQLDIPVFNISDKKKQNTKEITNSSLTQKEGDESPQIKISKKLEFDHLNEKESIKTQNQIHSNISEIKKKLESEDSLLSEEYNLEYSQKTKKENKKKETNCEKPMDMLEISSKMLDAIEFAEDSDFMNKMDFKNKTTFPDQQPHKIDKNFFNLENHIFRFKGSFAERDQSSNGVSNLISIRKSSKGSVLSGISIDKRFEEIISEFDEKNFVMFDLEYKRKLRSVSADIKQFDKLKKGLVHLNLKAMLKDSDMSQQSIKEVKLGVMDVLSKHTSFKNVNEFGSIDLFSFSRREQKGLLSLIYENSISTLLNQLNQLKSEPYCLDRYIIWVRQQIKDFHSKIIKSLIS